MKRFSTLLVILLCVSCVFAQYQPSEANLQARKEFQDSKFGIFIHWGLYSMLAHGEWALSSEKLNAEEYARLADAFYPIHFDADAWVKSIKDAGAKYVTFTTRHHDGFSLFSTKASAYNVMDATPFKRDIVKELAQACQKYGIKLHLYYSHLDWTRLDYPLGRTGVNTGRPKDQWNFNSYFNFMNQQLTELLTQYGPIGCIWFDGLWDHDTDTTPFNWRLDEQYALIHQLQPACLVLNNHHRVPFPGEDIQGFEQDLPGENTHGYSGQEVTKYPLEACMTMNKSWGYDIRDRSYKSVNEIITKLVRSAGKNCNLLLNVGPRPDGQFPAEALERLKKVGEWLKINGETIYGTRQGIIAPKEWGVTTQKDNKLYVHILNGTDKGLYLPLDTKQVKSAVMFVSRAKVGIVKSGEGITLSLPESPQGVDTIIEMELK